VPPFSCSSVFASLFKYTGILVQILSENALIRKAIKLKWVNPAHLCFLGTDLEIPPHPSKHRVGRNKKGKTGKAAG
jgi:hypothetical protein